MPALLKNKAPLAVAASIAVVDQLLISAIACSANNGMFKVLANPLPDPFGIMAKCTLEPIILDAISLIEPSPPTATTAAAFFSMACLASSLPCFAYFVCQIS